MLKLKIPNKIFEEIIQEAGAQLPIEACGILAGTDGLIEKYYKMTKKRVDPVREEKKNPETDEPRNTRTAPFLSICSQCRALEEGRRTE